MNNRLNDNMYTIQRKVMTVGGAKFYINNSAGALVAFCKQKAFKLKEDVRLFTDESMTEEILIIKARKAVDFSGTYDLIEPATGSSIGTIQRQGMKSMLQDEWHVLKPGDVPFGIIKEDSMKLALVRRFLSNLVPQNFDFYVGDKVVVDLKQAFNPFVYSMNVDFTLDTDGVVDKRVGLGAAIMIATIDGRQN